MSEPDERIVDVLVELQAASLALLPPHTKPIGEVWPRYEAALNRFRALDLSKLRAADARVQALAAYVKHRSGCASGWRAATGSSEIGPCDCGLDAALTEPRREADNG